MEFLKKALLAGLAALLPLTPALASDQPQGEWLLINPSGEIEKVTELPAPRPDSLAGLTIGLRWNGKHNGDVFLDRLAVLLAEHLPDVKLVKLYQEDPSINIISSNDAESNRITDVIRSYGPDLVIASQAD